MSSLWDRLWTRLRLLAGACASSVELNDLKEYLEKGEQYTRNAARMAYFAELNPRSVHQLNAAADAIGEVRSTVSSTLNVCMDLRAVARIHAAITILNDRSINRPGCEEAALAYGQLFVGVGRFAERLPPPANAYAQILKNSGRFFVNMQRMLDPQMRWKEQFELIEW